MREVFENVIVPLFWLITGAMFVYRGWSAYRSGTANVKARGQRITLTGSDASAIAVRWLIGGTLLIANAAITISSLLAGALLAVVVLSYLLIYESRAFNQG